SAALRADPPRLQYASALCADAVLAMARKLKTPTPAEIERIQFVREVLREAHWRAKSCGCPQLAKKIQSAIKSVEGASRHAWRAYRAHRIMIAPPLKLAADPL